VSEPFSLLLPVWAGDRPDFLAAAFRSSVDAQQRRPDEVVIVRDGPVGAELTACLDELVASSPVPVQVLALDRNVIAVRARFADPFNHPTVVMRRELVRRVGGYGDFALMEDYHLWAKMLLAGARVANVAEPLVRYRIGAGAYARRGGLGQLRAELGLQRRFRAMGFTTWPQFARNVLVRGGDPPPPPAGRRPAPPPTNCRCGPGLSPHPFG